VFFFVAYERWWGYWYRPRSRAEKSVTIAGHRVVLAMSADAALSARNALQVIVDISIAVGTRFAFFGS
jgi:hypothetical protein